MNKERLILIVVIIIIIIAGAFLVFNGSSNDSNTFKLSDAQFTLPDGYYTSIKVTSGVAETINITNGSSVIYIVEYKTGDLNKSISDYKSRMNLNNISANITTENINGLSVYKSSIDNDTHTRQFWFEDHNHVYSIYTWNGNNNTDDVVESLINSIKFPIFSF